jgi:hypothetical protein
MHGTARRSAIDNTRWRPDTLPEVTVPGRPHGADRGLVAKFVACHGREAASGSS